MSSSRHHSLSLWNLFYVPALMKVRRDDRNLITIAYFILPRSEIFLKEHVTVIIIEKKITFYSVAFNQVQCITR